MKIPILLVCVVFTITHAANVARRCANLMDESCLNGGLIDSTSDDAYLSGGSTPGKRCANLMDESCINGGLPDTTSDDAFLNGGATPGKRCANLMDQGCQNGGLVDAADDDAFLNGGGTPGKRDISLLLLRYLQVKRFCQQYPEQPLCVRYRLGYRRRGVLGSWWKGTKRCANVFDEGCMNGGLIGAVQDGSDLTDGLNPGRR